MDDQCSVLSSYWDATSITSDTTLPTDCYHTPIGSLVDLQNSEYYSSDTDSGSLTPVFHDLQINEQLKDKSAELKTELEIESMDNNDTKSQNKEVYENVSVKLRQPCVDEQNEIPADKSSKKKSWKHDLARRLSFTRSRIMKSFSIHKSSPESRSTKHIFDSLRQSMRRMRSFDKKPKSSRNPEKTASTSTSVVIGSDCDYFNFEKDHGSPDSNKKDNMYQSFEADIITSTPLKPRRQFTQEKYLTGSQDMLKKAFNSLKRKSHVQDDKSLFDICSTVPYLFMDQLDDASLSKRDEMVFRKLIGGCANAFLDVHKRQIENSLQLINKTIGEHIDLYSENLDVTSKYKKYKVSDLIGSKGVCIITNSNNKKQFVALNTTCTKSWLSFTSFLQHIEKDTTILSSQKWVCFPAQSITNLYIETNYFNPLQPECKSILDTLTQLIVILYCQMMDKLHIKINPSNVLLVSSDLAIIFVFIESEEGAIVSDEKDWLNIIDYSDKDMKLSYQNSIMELNKYVDKFLSLPENSSHLITASYPLDYLFYLLLKLNKDINVLLDGL